MNLKLLLSIFLLLSVVACGDNVKETETDDAATSVSGGDSASGSASSISLDDVLKLSSDSRFETEEERLAYVAELERMGNLNSKFAFNSAELDDDARAILESHAEFLRNNPSVKAEIQGHCDERGSSEYNLSLGERRANQAFDFLIINQGIDPSRLSVVSYGELEPIATCHDESCWSQNRRAQFKYSD